VTRDSHFMQLPVQDS